MSTFANRLLFSPRLQAVRVVLAVCIGVAALAYAQYAIPHPLSTFDLYYFSGAIERHGSYTNVGAVLALAANHHRSVDPEGAYGGPSLVALFFQPISLLPLWQAHIVWEATAAIAMTLGLRKAAPQQWPLWLAGLVVTPVVLMGWGVANAVLLTTPLLIYTYAALRNGQDKRAGVALAIATSLKLYPAFLLLVLLFTRRWRALSWTVGTLALLGAVTVVALGPDDAISAARLTLHLGHSIHPGPQNISLPGIAVALFNSSWGQPTLVISTLAAIGVTFVMRKAPVHIIFAASCTAMLLSQSMTWREYTMLAVVNALALKDSEMDKRSRIIVAVGVLLCIGTSWTPHGLETGINFVSQGLWNITNSGSPSTPGITQTLGLLLATGGLLNAALVADRLAAAQAVNAAPRG